MRRAELIVYRICGQPKISKPKELKGIKPAFSLKFCGRKNQVYIAGEDVCVYFFDLFSRDATFPKAEDMALPTSALQRKYPERFPCGRKIRGKFVYADGWCTMRQRNEGYVRFPGLIPAILADDWNTMRIPQLQFSTMEGLVALSTQDQGFCSLSPGGFRYAEYGRFISDMIGKIYQQHKK